MFGVRIVQVPHKAELISELKSAIRSTVAEAIEEVVNPLRQLINEHHPQYCRLVATLHE
jgi:hypothetical protein